MKMIAKRFSSSSAGVLLEKSYQKKITECSGTKRLWGSLSLVKPYVVHLKRNFSIYFFLGNFKKSRKNTNAFIKINRACFDEYLYKYFLKVDKTVDTCRSLSKQSVSKCSEQMYNVESSGKYFSFCPHLIWRSHSCLISFCLFDGIWWKCKACVHYF